MTNRRTGELAKSYLLRELKVAGASDWIRENAQEGLYDEIESTLATPLVILRRDLMRDLFSPTSAIVNKVRNGAFDASPQEWDEWMRADGGTILRAVVEGDEWEDRQTR